MGIRETSDGGRPIVVSQPDNSLARTFVAIAERIREKVGAARGAEPSQAPRIVMQ